MATHYTVPACIEVEDRCTAMEQCIICTHTEDRYRAMLKLIGHALKA